MSGRILRGKLILAVIFLIGFGLPTGAWAQPYTNSCVNVDLVTGYVTRSTDNSVASDCKIRLYEKIGPSWVEIYQGWTDGNGIFDLFDPTFQYLDDRTFKIEIAPFDSEYMADNGLFQTIEVPEFEINSTDLVCGNETGTTFFPVVSHSTVIYPTTQSPPYGEVPLPTVAKYAKVVIYEDQDRSPTGSPTPFPTATPDESPSETTSPLSSESVSPSPSSSPGAISYPRSSPSPSATMPAVGMVARVDSDDPQYAAPFYARTSADGAVFFPVDVAYTYWVEASGAGFNTVYETVYPDPFNAETTVIVYVGGSSTSSGDTTLNFNFLDDDGDPLTLPGSNSGSIDCQSLVDLQFYGISVGPGSPGGTVSAPAGQLECGVWINGYYPVTNILIDIQTGQTLATDVTLIEQGNSAFSDDVRIEAVNDSGDRVTDGCFEVNIWSEDGGTGGSSTFFNDTFQLVDGRLDVSLFSGADYGATIYPCDAITAQNYIIPFEGLFFTVDGNSSAPIEFIVLPTGNSAGTTESNVARLDVSVVDSSGNPVDGWVQAFWLNIEEQSGNDPAAPMKRLSSGKVRSHSPDDSDFDQFQSGETKDGLISLFLFPDREYEVVFYPDSNNFLNPPVQRLILAPAEQRALTFSVGVPDHTVKVKPVFDGLTPEVIQGLWCTGFNGSGQESFGSHDPETGLVTVGISARKRGATWSIICNSVVNEKFYRGEADVEIKKGKRKSTVEVTLVNTEQQFYSEECETFDLQRPKRVKLPDGKSEIDIPAGAFGENGTGQVCFQTGFGYTITDQNFPTLAFDFKFTVDGEEVREPLKKINIRFPIDQAELQKFGANLDNVAIATYDPISKSWRRDAVFEVREENGEYFIVAPVPHFSIWGTLINVAKELRKTFATNFRAKRMKSKKGRKRKVRLSWAPPEQARESQTYDVQMVKLTKKNLRYEREGNDIDDKSKSTDVVGTNFTRNVKSGRYRFRVLVKGGKTPPEDKKFKVK